MAVQWPVDKLTLINRALAQTGDYLVAVAEDGSDRWNVCSPAYEDALAVMLEEHGWIHATKINADLQSTGTAPSDSAYDTSYAFPSDLLHLIWVRLADSATQYDLQGGQLNLNNIGSDAVAIKYVSTDNSDPQLATPLFVRALTTYVMAGIYRGLHGDKGEAERLYAAAQEISQRARTRSDQQKPKRALFNSRITMARRVRRPWPTAPMGWGGGGSGTSE